MKKIILGAMLSTSLLASAFAGHTHQSTATSSVSCQGLEACHVTIQAARVKYTEGLSTEVKMDIKNSGDKTVDIVAAYSPVDEQTQLHHFVLNKEGNRVMRPIKSIEVYPHNTVDLSYQEVHVMLMRLKHPLKKGEMVPVTLILHDGSSLQVSAKVS